MAYLMFCICINDSVTTKDRHVLNLSPLVKFQLFYKLRWRLRENQLVI